MKTFSFYNVQTGEFHPRTYADSRFETVPANQIPEGHAIIEGRYDVLSQRVDIENDGAVVDWRPPQPSPAHEWDGSTKRWVLSPAERARQLKRASALAQIAALESKGLRAQRELALGYDGAKQRLQAIDDQIAALRSDLT